MDKEVTPKLMKPRKKHSTELERLEINVKGWNYLKDNINIKTFMNAFMNYDVVPEDKGFNEVIWKFEGINDKNFINNVGDDFDNQLYLL